MIRFNPNGHLDITSDPSDLVSEKMGKDELSGGMVRCTNLNLDREGIAKTRDGTSKFNSSALAQTGIHTIITMAGVRYTFAGTVIYRNEISIATGLTSSKWSGVKYNSYNATTQNIFALNGTDRKRIEASTVTEWGIVAPAAAPTLTDAGTGVTGTYTVKYTYARVSGSTVLCESDPSAAASKVVSTGLHAEWTASSDTQVTHVRVYRSIDGGASWLFDEMFAKATTESDLTTVDASLGSAVATDHDRPPLGTIVAGPDYNGYCFIAKDNLLYFSKPKQPEYWPTDYYLEVSTPDDPIKALQFFNGSLYVFSRSSIWQVQGTGYQSFAAVPISKTVGALGMDTVLGVADLGIFHVHTDGVWLFNGVKDTKVTHTRFGIIFDGTAVGTIPAVSTTNIANSLLGFYKGKMYFGYPASGSTYCDDWLVWDFQTGRVSHYDFNGAAIRCLSIDYDNDKLIAGDNAGFVWRLEDPDATLDGATAISWDIQSKDYTDQLRRYFPRYAKYDVTGTATATIYLDGSSVQTHALSTSRSTKKRLVATGNGNRISVRLNGSGTVTIYSVEVG